MDRICFQFDLAGRYYGLMKIEYCFIFQYDVSIYNINSMYNVHIVLKFSVI